MPCLGGPVYLLPLYITSLSFLLVFTTTAACTVRSFPNRLTIYTRPRLVPPQLWGTHYTFNYATLTCLPIRLPIFRQGCRRTLLIPITLAPCPPTSKHNLSFPLPCPLRVQRFTPLWLPNVAHFYLHDLLALAPS